MIEILKEHKENISKIFKLAKVDLIKTYKGSWIGWLWAVLKPSITIFVYWFTIEIGLKSSKFRHGYPNFFWLTASIVPWFYFSKMLVSGAHSYIDYKHLVTKIKFPITIIPTFVNLSNFFVHLIMELIVIAIFCMNGYGFDLYMLQIVFYMLMAFIFFELWSILTSMLSVISKDFFNLVRALNIFIFWMSGILWDIDDIGIGWVKKILWFNPIAYLVDGYRNCFINKIYFFEQPKRLIIFLSTLVVLAVLCSICHKKLRKKIPDIL